MKLIIKNDSKETVKNPNVKIIETTEASFTNQTVFIEENDVPIIKFTDTESMYFVKDLDNLYDRKSRSEVLLDITIDNLELIGSGSGGDVDSVLETQNKLITISLGDLGVTIEDVTYEMVADYINNLGIVAEKGENYYFKVLEEAEPEFEYNFDLTTPNWASEGVTDEASFINWLATKSNFGNNDLTNIVVTDFNFVDDRVYCNMTADGTTYDLASLGFLNVDKVGIVSGLTTLYLNQNQIEDFNPTIPLPSSLTDLYLGNNPMTLAGYTASEVWANAQPAFTNPCYVFFNGNIDSITGTNLEAILITKNCVITA